MVSFFFAAGHVVRLCFLCLVTGSGHCISDKNATVRMIMVLQEGGLVSFGSLVGP